MSSARLGGGEWYLSLRTDGGSPVSMRLERGVGVRGTAISDIFGMASALQKGRDSGRANGSSGR